MRNSTQFREGLTCRILSDRILAQNYNWAVVQNWFYQWGPAVKGKRQTAPISGSNNENVLVLVLCQNIC